MSDLTSTPPPKKSRRALNLNNLAESDSAGEVGLVSPPLTGGPLTTLKSRKRKGECLQVAVVGHSGSYAHSAAQQIWGFEQMLYVPCRSIREVFKAVCENRSEVGVVPIENTTVGHIHQVYDFLLQFGGLSIIGEVKQREKHVLCAPKGVELKDITRVVSHPVALKQCSDFLIQLKDGSPKKILERVEAGDTASACSKLATSGRKDTAAIANYEVAQMHKLEILREGISTDINNQTRFVVISKSSNLHDDILASHQTKTTVAFALKNTAGSLFKALSVFALRDINILQILTRPSTCASDLLPEKFHWEFIVVIDIQGSRSDENVANALRNLEDFAISYRVFGSYVSAPDQKLKAQQRFDHVLSILQTNPH